MHLTTTNTAINKLCRMQQTLYEISDYLHLTPKGNRELDIPGNELADLLRRIFCVEWNVDGLRKDFNDLRNDFDEMKVQFNN